MSSPKSLDTARRRSWIRLAVLVLFGALVAGAVVLVRQAAAPAWPPRDWSMVACDVGQGDALLLRTGPTSAIAVDTGPEPDRENACLRRFAITDIPLVILTHFHADHIGGLPGLLPGRKVGAIETTIVDDPPAGAKQVRAEAAAAGVPVRRVQPFERGRIGRVAWHALWPDPDELPSIVGAPKHGDEREEPMGGMGGMGSEGSGPNNSSIVLAVSIDPDSMSTDSVSAAPDSRASPSAAAGAAIAAGSPGAPLSVLMTGDIESPVQQLLLTGNHRDELRATVLKVPHHGSSNQAPGFFAAVDPSVAVISVGHGNPYGHPAARALRLAGSDGARVYRTDLDGDVVIGQTSVPGQVAVRGQHGDGVPGDQAGGPGAQPGASPTRRHGSGKSHARHQPMSD